ncbi:MAG: Hsp20/alpha crystallin family protein [Saprospiraceae bacterium]|jgi:HSP20 family protein
MKLSRIHPAFTAVNRNQPSVFDLFLNDFFHDHPTTGSGEVPTNIIEDDNNLVFELAIPGLEKKDIEIKAEGEKLAIKAEKKFEVNENHRFLRREFGQIRYNRVFELPNYVDVNGIKANYEEGILRITISKKAVEKPKLISVA